MSTHVHHGYINSPENASSNPTLEADKKTRYMNVADIGQSEQSVEYDTIDYERLSREGSKNDSHVYRDLQNVTPDTVGHQAGTDVEKEHAAAFMSNGTRKFVVIIVVLVAILVAMAAAMVVVYLTLRSDSETSSSTASDTVETSTHTMQQNTSASSPTTGSVTTTIALSPAITESLEERCQKYGGVIPHPSFCQAYYNCSEIHGSDVQHIAQYIMECPYPRHFSTETLSCEHFEKVTCGDRKEAKNFCDYGTATCGTAHCVSCDRYHYQCEGKPDGLNPQESRRWSPFYVVCYKERFVRFNKCPREDAIEQYFSPDYNACVSLFYIPLEHGGWMPNCTGKEDGLYPNEHGMCKRYTRCSWEQYIDTHVCVGGTTFDEVLKECVASPENLCICAGQGCNQDQPKDIPADNSGKLE